MDHFHFEPVTAAVWLAVVMVSLVVVLTRILAKVRTDSAYRRQLVVKA